MGTIIVDECFGLLSLIQSWWQEGPVLAFNAVLRAATDFTPCASTEDGHILRLVEVKGEAMPDRVDLPQGTLDLLILRTLSLGPQHGWAISERVQQISDDVLQIQQGSLYPALHRLERRGWIKAKWGTSDNNRRAKYYELTRSGQKQLSAEQDAWEKLTAAVAQVLRAV